MKKLILSSMFLSAALFAGEKAEVKVKGMVCSFCAQGIKKKFASEAAVSTIDVNLDDKWVKIEFKDGQSLPDAKITELITSAGYNVASIQRSPASDGKK